MNDFLQQPEPIARREFLKRTSAATAAAWAMNAPLLWADETTKHPKPKADACILLWMAGGMAAPDTFDPKRYSPFEKGLDVNRILSTFPAIDTNVDGIRFTKGLEKMAQIMDRGSLIRSHFLPDLGSILHSRHQYHWHTGYVPPQTVAAPHIGAWMARVLGPRNKAMPAFIDIGQRLENTGEEQELKAFHTAGFFGSEFGPFLLPHPDEAIAAVRPPEGMTPKRFESRYRHFRELVRRSPRGEQSSDDNQESMIRAMENAYQLLSSPERKAFDLSLVAEDEAKPYGKTRFGRGCLLAKRLVANGARFVEVTTEYEPFKQWDSHESGHTTHARMKTEIDAPIAQLIRDLETTGALERTLVVVASEFSRDMMIEGVPGSNAFDQSRAKTDRLETMKQYGLHRHFTGSNSVLMFGGGIKRGYLHGETAEERPLMVTKDPVSLEDLHATIFHAMGISPKTAFDIEKRPFYATKDGTGKPIMELFA